MSFDKATIHGKSLLLPNIHPRYSHTRCPQLVTFKPPGLIEHEGTNYDMNTTNCLLTN